MTALDVQGSLRLVGVQPGGTVVVSYTTWEADGAHRHLARLNPDGSLAAGATFRDVRSAQFREATVQPDGGVLVTLDRYSGSPPLRFDRVELVRLGADLRPDVNFRPAFAAAGTNLAVAVQPDGAVLVGGGAFTLGEVTPRRGMIRLRSDGSPDYDFFSDLPPSASVGEIAVGQNGKLLVNAFLRGDFPSLIAGLRLNADGRQDTGFLPPRIGSTDPSPTLALSFLTPLPDGRTLLGGSFNTVNGEFRRGFARLNPDGSVDRDYNPRVNPGPGPFGATVQPDGKVLLRGSGDLLGPAFNVRQNVARLLPDGSLDASFDAGRAFTGPAPKAVAVQPDGKIIVAGAFSAFNDVARPGVVRFNPDGSLDADFFAALTGPPTSDNVNTVAVTSDGGILLGGVFRRVNGSRRAGIVRLRPDGSLDGNFAADVGGGEFATVTDILILPDGNVLLTGTFTTVNNVPRRGLARLLPDGRLDPGFDAGDITPAGDGAPGVLVQPDGKLLVTGNTLAGIPVPEPYLVRLNADGSRDAAYQPNIGGALGFHPRLAAVQPDGKALLRVFLQGTPDFFHSLIRLKPDGSVDPGFRVSPGQLPRTISRFGPEYGRVTVLPDGRLLVFVTTDPGGNGDQPGDTAVTSLRRFNADGSADPAVILNALTSVNLIRQADGKLFLLGTSNGALARYDGEGRRDPGFVPRRGVEGAVNGVAVQADGNVLIGGGFARVQGVPRPGLARLLGATPPGAPARPTISVTADRLTVSRGAGEVATVTFTRTGDDLSRPFKVIYLLDGLNNGTDYAGVPVVKKLKAGKTSASILVRPLSGGANGKVKLTVLPGVGYDVNAAAARVKVRVTE